MFVIEYMGNLFGIVMIVLVVKNLLVYNLFGYVSNVIGWFIVSVGFVIVFYILVLVSKKIILFGMNF